MTLLDLLPWANTLLLPAVGLLWRIDMRLARLEAIQHEHERRLDTHDQRSIQRTKA